MRTSLALLAVAAAAFAAPAVSSPTLVSSAAPVPPAAPVSGPVGPSFDAPEATVRHVTRSVPAGAPAAAHDHAAHTHAAPAPKPAIEPAPQPPKPRATPRRLTYGRWRTPEAAMRHLARAYNARNAEALKDVTTPAARDLLNPMRDWAPDLRLVSCTDTKAGSFECSFTHAIKGSAETGTATLRVNPARKQGWYATVVLDCG